MVVVVESGSAVIKVETSVMEGETESEYEERIHSVQVSVDIVAVICSVVVLRGARLTASRMRTR